MQARNREECARQRQDAAYRERNKERSRQWAADPANREHKRAMEREYVHSDEYRERRRERYATDSEYRAKIVAHRWHLTPDDVETKIHAQDGACGICGGLLGEKVHLDHIVPLSKGGPSTYENMQVAHPWCNLIKSNKLNFTISLEKSGG